MKHSAFLVLLIVAFFTCCLNGVAQDTIEHTVQRGESLKVLSRLYNVPEQDILLNNPGLKKDELYVGIKVNIPVTKVNEPILTPSVAGSTYVREANNYFDQGYYDKATKLYTKAIKRTPHADIFYMRGASYMHEHKYSKAISDFENALSRGDLTDLFTDNCTELLDIAKERNTSSYSDGGGMSRWGQIALATAAAFIGGAANYIFGGGGTMGGGTMGGGTMGGGMGYNPNATGFNPNISSDLVNLGYKTVQDVQQQTYNEYLQFIRYCKKPDGSDYTYDEWYAMKGQAIQEMNNQGGHEYHDDDDDGDGTNYKKKTTTNKKTPTTESKSCIKLYATDEAHCNNTGVCSRCNGKKKYMDYSFGIDHLVDPCITCGGTGVCPSCNGMSKR